MTTNEKKAKEIAIDYADVELSPKTTIYEACIEMAEWKDRQFKGEKKDLRSLVNMLPMSENNQTIIEDLKALLR